MKNIRSMRALVQFSNSSNGSLQENLSRENLNKKNNWKIPWRKLRKCCCCQCYFSCLPKCDFFLRAKIKLQQKDINLKELEIKVRVTPSDEVVDMMCPRRLHHENIDVKFDLIAQRHLD